MKTKSLSTMIRMTLLSLILLLSACRPSVKTISLATAPASPMAPTQALPTPTIPTATSRPQATPTVAQTPEPLDFSIIPTTFEQSGGWNLRHPYTDPNAPELITETSDGYQLNPDFQVTSIDLVYRWVGIGDSVHTYQRVERQGDKFWRNYIEIPASAVNNLVQSIVRLHPQPMFLSATTHTDDYPFWAIELNDIDGNTVLLYSESNAPNFAPWNVVYNGHLYAQFDGQIATALPDLFDVVEGQTMGSFWWGEGEDGYLLVTTINATLPPYRGYSGLMPLIRDFWYKADAQKGELWGLISGDMWSSNVKNMTINWMVDLQKIELFTDNDKSVMCTLDAAPATGEDFVNRRFTCTVGIPEMGTSFSYPIQLTYSNAEHHVYTLFGRLFGYWDTPTLLSEVPYPSEIGKIFQSYPVIGDLLNDHQIKLDTVFAKADPRTGSLDHSWEAEVILLGQVQVGKRILPYSVTLEQVTIEDAKPVHWDLERAELQALLGDVLNQPITQRFIEGDPNLVINLYYAETSDYPLMSGEDLQSCGDIPTASELPLPGEPLRGFSFNGTGSFYELQFLLMDDRLRVIYIDVDQAFPEDAFLFSLIPSSLIPQGAAPFSEIFTRYEELGIVVSWDEKARPSDIDQYKAMFDDWNVPKEYRENNILLQGVWFDVTPDGRLTVINCQLPDD